MTALSRGDKRQPRLMMTIEYLDRLKVTMEKNGTAYLTIDEALILISMAREYVWLRHKIGLDDTATSADPADAPDRGTDE